MARINISVPDYLHEAAKQYGLPLSQVCQEALRRELHQRRSDEHRLFRYRLHDGEWSLEPVPVTEYRLLDDPKPFLVFDGADRAVSDLFGTPWHTQLIEWTRSQGIDPNQVARIEVYEEGGPYEGHEAYAWVLLYDVDEDGSRFLVPGTETVAKHAETVPLSSLPPLPESTR